MPLFVRRARFYLRARPICKRGKNTRLKRLFEARGDASKYHVNTFATLAKRAAAVFAFGVIVFLLVCLRGAAARFIYSLCAVFVSFSLFLFCILFFVISLSYLSYLSLPYIPYIPYISYLLTYLIISYITRNK